MSKQNTTLTVREVAEILDVETRTIHRWIAKGYFPGAYKVGPARNSLFRIPQSTVDEFLEERKKRQVMGPLDES